MPGSIFTDKAKKPTARDVVAVLGDSVAQWDAFAQHIREAYAPISEEWRFYKCWHLRLKRKARTVCYLFAEKDQFTVAFVFGEKAVAAARKSKLPKRIMDCIEQARVYAEGRGFYVECRKASDLKHLHTLTAIKMETR